MRSRSKRSLCSVKIVYPPFYAAVYTEIGVNCRFYLQQRDFPQICVQCRLSILHMTSIIFFKTVKKSLQTQK